MKLEKSGGWGESIHRTGHGEVGLQIGLPIDPSRCAQCPGFGPERRKPLKGLRVREPPQGFLLVSFVELGERFGRPNHSFEI